MSRITPKPENHWYRIDCTQEFGEVIYDQDLGYALERAIDKKGYSKHHKVYRQTKPGGKWEHYDPNSMNLYQMKLHLEEAREKLMAGMHQKDKAMLRAANSELHFIWCGMSYQMQPR